MPSFPELIITCEKGIKYSVVHEYP